MPARIVYEVVRNTNNGNVAIGLVTDDFIAKQVIDRLYEEMRQLSFKPEREDLTLDFPAGIWAEIDSQSWDQWSINNRNGATPIFWARKKYLWNAVPSAVSNWNLLDVGDAFSQFPGDQPNVIQSIDSGPTVTNG